jgi:hypothetical protein
MVGVPFPEEAKSLFGTRTDGYKYEHLIRGNKTFVNRGYPVIYLVTLLYPLNIIAAD